MTREPGPGLRPRWSVGSRARACGPDGPWGREPGPAAPMVCGGGSPVSSSESGHATLEPEKRHADTYADVHAALRAAGRFGD